MAKQRSHTWTLQHHNKINDELLKKYLQQLLLRAEIQMWFGSDCRETGSFGWFGTASAPIPSLFKNSENQPDISTCADTQELFWEVAFKKPESVTVTPLVSGK